jgi:hypothetical protein
MIRFMSRRAAGALLCAALAPAAGAETLSATVDQWDLLGSWAIDCALRPDRDKGAVLTYEVKPDGRVIYWRNFGDAKDENEVVAASADEDGLLNIMVFLPVPASGARVRTAVADGWQHARDLQSRPARRVHHQGRQVREDRRTDSCTASLRHVSSADSKLNSCSEFSR